MEHNSLSLVFLLLLISLTSQSLQEPTTESSPISALVPALFVIGDSTVDCGTNNHLITFARANHPPYGCDFDTHSPTGRFSNGRIIVDFLGNVLSLIKITLFEHFFFIHDYYACAYAIICSTSAGPAICATVLGA